MSAMLRISASRWWAAVLPEGPSSLVTDAFTRMEEFFRNRVMATQLQPCGTGCRCGQAPSGQVMRRARDAVTYPLSMNHRAESAMAASAGLEV